MFKGKTGFVDHFLTTIDIDGKVGAIGFALGVVDDAVVIFVAAYVFIEATHIKFCIDIAEGISRTFFVQDIFVCIGIADADVIATSVKGVVFFGTCSVQLDSVGFGFGIAFLCIETVCVFVSGHALDGGGGEVVIPIFLSSV